MSVYGSEEQRKEESRTQILKSYRAFVEGFECPVFGKLDYNPYVYDPYGLKLSIQDGKSFELYTVPSTDFDPYTQTGKKDDSGVYKIDLAMCSDSRVFKILESYYAGLFHQNDQKGFALYELSKKRYNDAKKTVKDPQELNALNQIESELAFDSEIRGNYPIAQKSAVVINVAKGQIPFISLSTDNLWECVCLYAELRDDEGDLVKYGMAHIDVFATITAITDYVSHFGLHSEKNEAITFKNTVFYLISNVTSPHLYWIWNDLKRKGGTVFIDSQSLKNKQHGGYRYLSYFEYKGGKYPLDMCSERAEEELSSKGVLIKPIKDKRFSPYCELRKTLPARISDAHTGYNLFRWPLPKGNINLSPEYNYTILSLIHNNAIYNDSRLYEDSLFVTVFDHSSEYLSIAELDRSLPPRGDCFFDDFIIPNLLACKVSIRNPDDNGDDQVSMTQKPPTEAYWIKELSSRPVDRVYELSKIVRALTLTQEFQSFFDQFITSLVQKPSLSPEDTLYAKEVRAFYLKIGSEITSLAKQFFFSCAADLSDVCINEASSPKFVLETANIYFALATVSSTEEEKCECFRMASLYTDIALVEDERGSDCLPNAIRFCLLNACNAFTDEAAYSFLDRASMFYQAIFEQESHKNTSILMTRVGVPSLGGSQLIFLDRIIDQYIGYLDKTHVHTFDNYLLLKELYVMEMMGRQSVGMQGTSSFRKMRALEILLDIPEPCASQWKQVAAEFYMYCFLYHQIERSNIAIQCLDKAFESYEVRENDSMDPGELLDKVYCYQLKATFSVSSKDQVEYYRKALKLSFQNREKLKEILLKETDEYDQHMRKKQVKINDACIEKLSGILMVDA